MRKIKAASHRAQVTDSIPVIRLRSDLIDFVRDQFRPLLYKRKLDVNKDEGGDSDFLCKSEDRIFTR